MNKINKNYIKMVAASMLLLVSGAAKARQTNVNETFAIKENSKYVSEFKNLPIANVADTIFYYLDNEVALGLAKEVKKSNDYFREILSETLDNCDKSYTDLYIQGKNEDSKELENILNKCTKNCDNINKEMKTDTDAILLKYYLMAKKQKDSER